MKSIFNKEAYTEITLRLNKLSASSPRQWGKMDVAQMLAHCNKPIEYYLGKIQLKKSNNPILRLFKSILYNDRSFGKGAPTNRSFIISDKREFEQERSKLFQNLIEITTRGENYDWPPHASFGRMTGEQYGKSIYKHIDHHLKQFNT